LTDDEIAFYDAPAVNESAVDVMGDAQLKVIATELITQVRKKRLDRLDAARIRPRPDTGDRQTHPEQIGYPPDLQESAVKQVLMQAELICAELMG